MMRSPFKQMYCWCFNNDLRSSFLAYFLLLKYFSILHRSFQGICTFLTLFIHYWTLKISISGYDIHLSRGFFYLDFKCRTFNIANCFWNTTNTLNPARELEHLNIVISSFLKIIWHVAAFVIRRYLVLEWFSAVKVGNWFG